ncbi:MAG: hypothetical protein ACRBBN_03725 [Methyloligellaceae bacterium]
MHFVKVITGLLLAATLAGCAGGGAHVPQPVSYVSPILYETLECSQVADEARILTRQAQQVSGIASEQSVNSSVIVWPIALTAQRGGAEPSAELGQIKYRFEALERAAIRENCKVKFKRLRDANGVEQKSALSGWVTKLS